MGEVVDLHLRPKIVKFLGEDSKVMSKMSQESKSDSSTE